MSTTPSGTALVADDVPTSPRPRAATGSGSLLRAELGRLRRRRLIAVLVGVGILALVLAAAAVFFTHDRDVAAARAKAQAQYTTQVAAQQDFHRSCMQDPGVSEADRGQGACGPDQVDSSLTPQAFYSDPRLRADQGLPAIAIGIAVAGALLMGLVGATAVGADWSSRAIVTLLTWQPRRLRFLGTRLAAVAIVAAGLGVLGQALGLGLTAATVATRGTWAPTPKTVEGETSYGPSPGEELIAAGHFWRDLVLLQARGVALMVLAAVIAASIATITRSTGGFLGVALAWFVVVEVAGQGLLAILAPGLARWNLTQNAAALLTPGGIDIDTGQRVFNGSEITTTTHLSNLDGLWHLGLLAVVVTLVAGVLLQRRDL